MAAITSPFTAIGELSIPTRPDHQSVTVNISGTYGGLQFAFEGSVDGSAGWKALSCVDAITGALVSGTISPSDNASYIWRVPCVGMNIRMSVTAISSGSVAVASQGVQFPLPTAPSLTLTTLPAAITGTSCVVTAGLNSSGATGAGIGYVTGAGGAQTQGTNRTTGVTLSKLTGAITTHNASLAAGDAAEFTVTNTTVAVGDAIILSVRSGATTTQTNARVSTVAAGSFKIVIENNHASTAETGAIILNFAVIKAVGA